MFLREVGVDTHEVVGPSHASPFADAAACPEFRARHDAVAVLHDAAYKLNWAQRRFLEDASRRAG